MHIVHTKIVGSKRKKGSPSTPTEQAMAPQGGPRTFQGQEGSQGQFTFAHLHSYLEIHSSLPALQQGGTVCRSGHKDEGDQRPGTDAPTHARGLRCAGC